MCGAQSASCAAGWLPCWCEVEKAVQQVTAHSWVRAKPGLVLLQSLGFLACSVMLYCIRDKHSSVT